MSGYQDYGQPGMYGHVPPPNPNSSLAIASLVFGVLSFVCFSILTAVPAVICGHMVLGQIRRGEVAESNRGLAIAGLVLGYINIIIVLLSVMAYILFLIFFAAAISAGAGAASVSML